MAELAGLLTPGAIIEQLPARVAVASIITTPTSAPGGETRVKPPQSGESLASEPAKEARTAVAHPPSPANIQGAGTRDEVSLQQLDEVTLAAARSARLYRSWMFENLMAGFSAALDQAADMVGKQSSEPAGPKADAGATRLKARRVPPNEAADDYRAKALQLTNATINANLDYARRLATVRSPAEFIELSTDQVCAQVKLCVKHAVALARLSRSLTAIGLPKGRREGPGP